MLLGYHLSLLTLRFLWALVLLPQVTFCLGYMGLPRCLTHSVSSWTYFEGLVAILAQEV